MHRFKAGGGEGAGLGVVVIGRPPLVSPAALRASWTRVVGSSLEGGKGKVAAAVPVVAAAVPVPRGRARGASVKRKTG